MTINTLTLQVASGDALDVREFSVEESLSRLFEVRLTVLSTTADVDFEAAIGGAARFEILPSAMISGEPRYWNGICVGIEQIDAHMMQVGVSRPGRFSIECNHLVTGVEHLADVAAGV